MKCKSVWILGIVELCLFLLIACTPVPATPASPIAHCLEDTIDLTTLKYALCTDKATYQYGETIQVSFALTNTADKAVRIDGGDKPAVDILQEGSYWSSEHTLEATTQITLEAGAVYTIEWRWIPEQAFLTKLFPKWPAPSSVFFDGIVRYEPDDERLYWFSVKYLPDQPTPIPTANQLSGNCAGEQRAAGDLELQICTDKRDYQYGEPVQVRWQIRNISDSSITLDGGDAAAMDVHIVEWDLPPGAEYPVASGEERWSDEHTYETQIILAPGETHLVEWQWPTEHTDFDAVLEPMRVSGEDVAFVYIHGDYFLQPGNRWSYTTDIFYALEDDK